MKHILSAAVLILSVAACGGNSNPKAFVLTAKGGLTTAKGANGICDDVPDPKVTSVDFNEATTVYVYQGGDDKTWFLELPLSSSEGGSSTTTLQGTLDGDTYTFTGKTTRTQPITDFLTGDKTATEVSSQDISVTLTVKSATDVSGTLKLESKDACTDEPSQTVCEDGERPTGASAIDCVSTGNFAGVQLQDPEYKQAQGTPGDGNF